MISNTSVRSERLKSEKAIADLFDSGSSLSAHPIRLLFRLIPSENDSTFRIGFAVSKKNFKRAVDRNLLKRRMREAYRINIPIVLNDEVSGVEMNIMFVYQGNQLEEYLKISECMTELLKKLKQRISKAGSLKRS